MPYAAPIESLKLKTSFIKQMQGSKIFHVFSSELLIVCIDASFNCCAHANIKNTKFLTTPLKCICNNSFTNNLYCKMNWAAALPLRLIITLCNKSSIHSLSLAIQLVCNQGNHSVVNVIFVYSKTIFIVHGVNQNNLF